MKILQLSYRFTLPATRLIKYFNWNASSSLLQVNNGDDLRILLESHIGFCRAIYSGGQIKFLILCFFRFIARLFSDLERIWQETKTSEKKPPYCLLCREGVGRPPFFNGRAQSKQGDPPYGYTKIA